MARYSCRLSLLGYPTNMISSSLKITEIFHSLQGEARTVGRPTVFVRLTGCPLRCGYCDSEYAFYGGTRRSFADLLEEIARFRPRYLCVTGGEPLAQPACLPFLIELCEHGYQVSLETSGAMDISAVDARVSIVMDLKTPDSGEVSKNHYQNIALLKPKDQLKFVICSRQDYQWAKLKLDEFGTQLRVDDVLFSPSYSSQSASELADWIIADGLDVRFQMQLHKQLWGDKPGV